MYPIISKARYRFDRYGSKTVTLGMATVLLALATSVQAQQPSAAPPKTVQSMAGSLGGDWQAMSTALNHVFAGLQEMTAYANDLEGKVRTLTTEKAALQKKLDELEKKPTEKK